jgi:hypothetical protein
VVRLEDEIAADRSRQRPALQLRYHYTMKQIMQRTGTPPTYILLALVIFVLLPWPLLAQEIVLKGKVTDPQGTASP